MNKEEYDKILKICCGNCKFSGEVIRKGDIGLSYYDFNWVHIPNIRNKGKYYPCYASRIREAVLKGDLNIEEEI